jgi:hypothetical protein
MKTTRKIIVVWLVACFLFFQAMPLAAAENKARTEKRNFELAIVDLVATRPIGGVLMVLGFAAFVLSTPITAVSQNTDDAWDTLVGFPASYTFVRPLGQF